MPLFIFFYSSQINLLLAFSISIRSWRETKILNFPCFIHEESDWGTGSPYINQLYSCKFKSTNKFHFQIVFKSPRLFMSLWYMLHCVYGQAIIKYYIIVLQCKQSCGKWLWNMYWKIFVFLLILIFSRNSLFPCAWCDTVWHKER